MMAIPRHASSPTQVGAANGAVVQGSTAGQLIEPPAIGFAVASLGGWHVSGLLFVAGIMGALIALAVHGADRRLGAFTT